MLGRHAPRSAFAPSAAVASIRRSAEFVDSARRLPSTRFPTVYFPMPPLTALAIAHYRSLRELIVPLATLNVITGPNGSGKSSLYRALRLLADTAQGRVIPSLAREGGLPSTLWAGPERFSRGMLAGTCR
ncbi:hypothetical protein BMMON2_31030 [Burkholderia mallei]